MAVSHQVFTLYELCVDKVAKCVAKAQDLEALTIPVTVRKDLKKYKANTIQIEDAKVHFGEHFGPSLL